MRRLRIPSHIVGRYRERVHEDNDSHKRSSTEIRFLLEYSLYRIGCFKIKINQNTHVIVNFVDPFDEKADFGTYYVVLNPAEENDGSLVFETIKDIPNVLNRIRHFTYDLTRTRRIVRRTIRGNSERKRMHYDRYW
jgi:hypothetical protein